MRIWLAQHLTRRNRIILHNTGSTSGNFERFDREHRERGWTGCGYHWILGNGNGLRDGQIEPGRPEKYRGAHTKHNNSDSIGITLVGNFMRTEPTGNQIDSLIRLLKTLCFENNLDPLGKYKDTGKYIIAGHRDWRPAYTDCPGDNLHRLLPSIRHLTKEAIGKWV